MKKEEGVLSLDFFGILHFRTPLSVTFFLAFLVLTVTGQVVFNVMAKFSEENSLFFHFCKHMYSILRLTLFL